MYDGAGNVWSFGGFVVTTIVVLKRQWRRSSLRGFVKRLASYLFGQPCYAHDCKDRMYIEHIELHHWGIREAWRCDNPLCQATLGDNY